MLADADVATHIVASNPIDLVSRADVLARYRHLREISKQHHSAMMKFLSGGAIIAQARRLGLAEGKTIVLNNLDDMNLAVDLAIHTAPKDRSRAIDRYARAARLAPGSDEALVLEAMRRARFSIISSVRRHPAAGVIVKDVVRDEDIWLVDEGLEATFKEGRALATRMFAPEGFAMTAGIITPVDRETLAIALSEMPVSLRNNFQQTCEDRRFAEAIYRIALADGLTDGVAYQDPAGELG
jgi:hypothetical protein